MAYSELDDLKKQISEEFLKELTDDKETGEIDEAVVSRSIEDADSEIDSYCRSIYSVPFSTVPKIIRKLSVDIAIYNLYARRQGVPEDRLRRYKDAISLLKLLGEGEIRLQDVKEGPYSSALLVKPQFTRGKYDDSGNLLGSRMGHWDGDSGSLDEW